MFALSEHPAASIFKAPDPYFLRNAGEVFLNLLLPSALPMPGFLPFDFYRHPPQPPKGPEFIFPNLPLSTFMVDPITLTAALNFNQYRHPPVSWRSPEFIFPNLSLEEVGDLVQFFIPYDFSRHPPLPKPPEVFVATNLLPGLLQTIGLTPSTTPYDFARHPPPPPYYWRAQEFIFPNSLRTVYTVLVYPPVPTPYIRNAPYVLQQIRQAAPFLDK